MFSLIKYVTSYVQKLKWLAMKISGRMDWDLERERDVFVIQ